jgi:hypothetical protein
LWICALDDVRKNATYDSGQKAFALLSSGPDGQAKAVEALLADADRFKNSNMPDMEKKARDLAEIVKISPDARKAIGIHMAAIAPDKWEKFAKAMGPAERTTFQKDLAAAGIDPESPEGIRQSRAFVQNRTDPIVTMETPRGGQFTGPLSEFQRRYGSPATSMGVTVTTPDGQTFNFPNENAANLFRKKAGLE